MGLGELLGWWTQGGAGRVVCQAGNGHSESLPANLALHVSFIWIFICVCYYIQL